MSPYLHAKPIHQIVSLASVGKSHLEWGFILRCFQYLSRPYVATQQCRWHYNWYTSGMYIPLLSSYVQRLSDFLRPRVIVTELSHDVLYPASVPLQCVNIPNLGTVYASRMR